MTSKDKSAKTLLPALEWTEREVAVADLKPYERNPRRISKEAFARLVSDIRLNGYHQRIIATPDLRVIGGHQRIKALQEIGLKRIKVLTPSRDIPPAQFREMLVKDNLPFGDFDFDMLSADFDPDELIEWGMPAAWLGSAVADAEENSDDEMNVGEAFTVTCEFTSSKEQMKFFREIKSRGIVCSKNPA